MMSKFNGWITSLTFVLALTLPGGAVVAADSAVAVTVTTGSAPQPGLTVYAFDGGTYTGKSGVTNATGVATLTLPVGSYRFRIDKNGTQFFSAANNHCTVPDCSSVSYDIPESIAVTVTSSAGSAEAGLVVYAFDGNTYAGKSAATSAAGIAMFTLMPGNYRFRIDKNGTQFFTNTANHCAAPGCTAVSYEIPESIAVTVTSSAGGAEAGLTVYAFDGNTYTGKSSVTNAAGVATFTLLPGNYRFRIDKNGTQFFTSASNHCMAPGCQAASYEIPESIAIEVTSSSGEPEAGLTVYAFNGNTYTGKSATTNASGMALFTLLPGNYRFRIDKNGTQFFTGPANHCLAPGCNSVGYVIPQSIAVTVTSSAGGPESGLIVYAFDGNTYTGKSAVTNTSGQAMFTLLPGQYRFRIDKNGTQFFTGPANHCVAPGCSAVGYEVPPSVTVHVEVALGGAETGLNVYAFDGSTYSGKSAVTNASGDATFTLLPGNYRFRIDKAGSQYFTNATNHCAVPGCSAVTYLFPVALSLYVVDPNLGACLDATAASHGWTAPAQVTSLDCGNRGITNLAGIESFSNLASLSLVNNPITRLGPLQALSNLTALDLSGITVAECRELGELVATLGSGALTGPASCLGEGEEVFAVGSPDAPTTDIFGFALAATTLGDLVSSALTFDPVANSFAGRVYLLDGTNGDVLLTLQDPNPEANKAFGWAVAATPNNDVVAGSWQDGGDGGAVYVFNGATGSLLRTLVSPSPAANDRFGYAVAIAPDGRIAVGAHQDGGGTVYVFDAQGVVVQTITNPTMDVDAAFGQALAVNANGDLLVGAPGQDVADNTDAGVVYLYENQDGTLLQARTLQNPAPAAFDNYGGVVAAGPDDDVLVSARQQDSAAEDAGKVFLHRASDGALRWARANPVADPEGLFGTALAATPQGHVVVGAANDDNGATNSGRVFILDGGTGNLLKLLDNPEPELGAQFGESVASSFSGQIAVGASGAGLGFGKVYLFTSIAEGEALTPLDELLNTETFPDTNLLACIADSARAGGRSVVEEVTALDCSGVGLEDLTGLDALSDLENLDLSDNPALLCTDLDNLEDALPDTSIMRPNPCSTGVASQIPVQSLYNADGQRVAKTANGTTTHFIYDRMGRVLAELDAATGATLREYVYVNDQQIALVDDTSTPNEGIYFVHSDHLGTPQKITDGAQAEVWAADYEPFGRAHVRTSSINNNIRFPGQYEDEETGLHYNYFRDYDPTTGRYVESDPVGLNAGSNTYSYVLNNPLGHSDPFGLDVLLQAHPVALGQNHSKIVMIPQNQGKYATDPRFRNTTPDGSRYATLGAGPEGGYLVSNQNRPRDVILEHNVFSASVFTQYCPSPAGEDELIEKLFQADSRYQDSVDYEYFPGRYTDGHNSNSYASGLLRAVGFPQAAPPSTPGFSKPLPNRAFEPRRIFFTR